MLYSENQMIDLIRKAGVIQMKDDWLGISGNTLSSTLGMGGITPDPAQPKGCYSGQDRAMQDARLQARANFNGCYTGAAAVMTDEEKRRRKACPGKPLTKHPSRYLTEVDGTNCNKDAPAKHGPFKWQQKGVDTDKFRKQCEESDKGES